MLIQLFYNHSYLLCSMYARAPEFDMKELESLFSAAGPNSDRGSSGDKSNRRASLGAKSDKVQLVNLSFQLVQNIFTSVRSSYSRYSEWFCVSRWLSFHHTIVVSPLGHSCCPRWSLKEWLEDYLGPCSVDSVQELQKRAIRESIFINVQFQFSCSKASANCFVCFYHWLWEVLFFHKDGTFECSSYFIRFLTLEAVLINLTSHSSKLHRLLLFFIFIFLINIKNALEISKKDTCYHVDCFTS